MNKADLIFLVGMPGSGKSTEGKKLAKQLDWDFIDLDQQIALENGQEIADIFDNYGEAHFRQLESTTLKSLNRFNRTIIACGGGTIAFNNNMDWIKKNGISIYFKAEPKLLLNRILAGKMHRPLFFGLSKEEIFVKIEELLAARKGYFEQSTLIVELPLNSRNELINNILSLI